MPSIWTKLPSPDSSQKLDGDRQTEVAVIGAGMTGILTASLLQQKGYQVVVLESGCLGGGQTQNTTAKITCQHGDIYHKLMEKNAKKATLYARANLEAVREFQRFSEERDIACEMSAVPSYLYTMQQPELLEKELAAAESCGIAANLTKETALPFSVAAALRYPDQLQFHPLKFLYAMAEGLTVFEDTPVIGVTDDNISTPTGMVRAEKIVFASHFPLVNVPGMFFTKLYQDRTYFLALQGADKLDGLYYGVDEGGHSFRNAEHLLLMGGESHRTGKATGGCYARLRNSAKTYYPRACEKMCWSAQDVMSPDGVPLIGQYSPLRPNWFVATGYGKWGMSTSMVAARLLTDLIDGEKNPYAALYAPHRFQGGAGFAGFASNGSQAVKGTIKRLLPLPSAKVDSLKKGEARITSVKGHQYGIFRDSTGSLHVVSAKCPHLGCRLEWNPDELSWDCPCHGSRFDYEGNLLDEPATEGIKVKKGLI